MRELSVAASKFDVMCCSETLTTNCRNQVEFLIPGFNKPILHHRDSIPRAQGMAVYIRSGFAAYRKSSFECSCHEMRCVRVCGKYTNFYIFACYRNPDANDQIFDCLLVKMAAVQEADVKAAFVVMGDFNAHQQQWLSSGSATDSHGRAASDFASLSGTVQLISEPTHVRGNCLDIIFTDVPGLLTTSVGTPIGSSDHCLISCTVKVVQNLPGITISQRVYLKSRANWVAISRDISSISWHRIFNSEDPV